jgi:hypothetical protein
MKINKKILVLTIVVLIALFAIAKRDYLSKTFGWNTAGEGIAECGDSNEKTARAPESCNAEESSSLFMGCNNVF